MDPITITFIIAVLVVISFIAAKIPYGLTAILCCVALQLTGVLEATDAWGGFANTTVFLFGSIFVLGAGLMKTSFIDKIKELINGLGGKESKITILCMLMAIVLAIFMNATSTTAAMLPIIMVISAQTKIPRSKLLMPITYVADMWVAVLPFGMGAAIFAQCNAVLEAVGAPANFGFFDNAIGRIPVLIIVSIAIFFLRKFVPNYPETVTPIPESTQIDTKVHIKATTLSPTQDILGIAIFFGTIVCMGASTWTKWPAYCVAVIGAALMVIFGILDGKEAFKAVDVNTISIFAGMLSLATALSKTGAGDLIANGLKAAMGNTTNPYIISACFLIVPWAITQFMNNIAVSNLMLPLAALVAANMGMDPRGAMIGVLAGCTLSICTPMACAPNALIMEPGSYKFLDYLKIGLPVSMLFLIVYVLWIPLVFPPF